MHTCTCTSHAHMLTHIHIYIYQQVMNIWDLTSNRLLRTVPVFEPIEAVVALSTNITIGSHNDNRNTQFSAVDSKWHSGCVALAGQKGSVRVYQFGPKVNACIYVYTSMHICVCCLTQIVLIPAQLGTSICHTCPSACFTCHPSDFFPSVIIRDYARIWSHILPMSYVSRALSPRLTCIRSGRLYHEQ